MIAQTLTTTKWGLMFRHWFLSSVLLPLYAVGLVTFTWKKSPQKLSRVQGVFVIAISLVFYGLLWTSLGLLIAYERVRKIFPPQQAVFVVFVYLMCCFAESMLKNTYVGSVLDHQAPNLEKTRAVVSGHEPALQQTRVQTTSGEWTVIQFLETILFISAPTQHSLRVVNVINFVLTSLYATVILGLHLYFALEVHDFGAAVIVYIVIETILQGTLCLIILYPLSQVAVRLSVRDKVARVFSEATTTLCAAREEGGDHTFRLNTLQNVKAWQMIRDTLLRRYAFPTLYVDVVVSAAFTLWVPLVMVGVMDFVFQASITPLALNAIALAVLILGYLLVCVVLASKVQETLSNTDVLRWQEYHFLVSTTANAEIEKLTHILKRLAQLIDAGKENAVVFQVWGFPLNRKMATFLGGVLVTLASSVVVRVASKVASF